MVATVLNLTGTSVSVNVNTSSLVRIVKLNGNSSSVSVVSGKLRLLGLTTPADQLYLNSFLLSSPNKRVTVLKQHTFVALNKNDFV